MIDSYNSSRCRHTVQIQGVETNQVDRSNKDENLHILPHPRGLPVAPCSWDKGPRSARCQRLQPCPGSGQESEDSLSSSTSTSRSSRQLLRQSRLSGQEIPQIQDHCSTGMTLNNDCMTLQMKQNVFVLQNFHHKWISTDELGEFIFSGPFWLTRAKVFGERGHRSDVQKPPFGGSGGRRGSAMVPFERAMVVSYRLSIVTIALSLTTRLQFAISNAQVNRRWIILGQDLERKGLTSEARYLWTLDY